MVSPSDRPPIVDNDWNYLPETSFPRAFASTIFSPTLALDPAQSPLSSSPPEPRPSDPHQSSSGRIPELLKPPRPFVCQPASSPLAPTTLKWKHSPTPTPVVASTLQTKLTQQSDYKYYIVFYGHEDGIFKSGGWGVGFALVTIPRPN